MVIEWLVFRTVPLHTINNWSFQIEVRMNDRIWHLILTTYINHRLTHSSQFRIYASVYRASISSDNGLRLIGAKPLFTLYTNAGL